MIGARNGLRLSSRVAARLAMWQARPGTLVWQAEPPGKGDGVAARRLADGILLFGGTLVETDAPVPWQIDPPDAQWCDHLHGHGWLDDAAASDDPQVWAALSTWVWDWIGRYGTGDGPGWRPDLVARRLTRLIACSVRLLRGEAAERSHLLFRSITAQTRFLGWRWQDTQAGYQRIEALTGLVYALLSLEGSNRTAARMITHLGKTAQQVIDPSGGLASRNPEELGRCLAALDWCAAIIADAGLVPDPRHGAAIRRGAPVLAALRHGNGQVARFHGARSGADLPDIVPPPGPNEDARGMNPKDGAMGYLTLRGGVSHLVLDGAPPPSGPHAGTAHCSALAFEFSQGTTPIIVNRGNGAAFGARTARGARRSPSHSTVELAGRCPARLLAGPSDTDPSVLGTTGDVTARISHDQAGDWAICASHHYEAEYGLVIERRLHLSGDGLSLSGEDTALATRSETRDRFNTLFPPDLAGCPMIARFHLHPDVNAMMALSGTTVALTLPDRSRWLLRADADSLSIEPSQYFDEDRLTPRATLQVVAKTEVLEYWGRITWSLERLADEPGGLSRRTGASSET